MQTNNKKNPDSQQTVHEAPKSPSQRHTDLEQYLSHFLLMDKPKIIRYELVTQAHLNVTQTLNK